MVFARAVLINAYTHIQMINGRIHQRRRFRDAEEIFLKCTNILTLCKFHALVFLVPFPTSIHVTLVHAPLFSVFYLSPELSFWWAWIHHISAINWRDFHSVTHFTWWLSVFKINIFWTVKGDVLFSATRRKTFTSPCTEANFMVSHSLTLPPSSQSSEIYYYFLTDYKSK